MFRRRSQRGIVGVASCKKKYIVVRGIGQLVVVKLQASRVDSLQKKAHPPPPTTKKLGGASTLCLTFVPESCQG